VSEEIWGKAYFAYLQAGLHCTAASVKADEAVDAYAERWPHSEAVATVPSGFDLAMVGRAVAQLEADNRIDARLVLNSLLEALRTAQQHGERLTRWMPPPRGG